MPNQIVTLGKAPKSLFKDKVMEILPEGGNLNACLTCGLCASGCPASGLVDMDPRRFLRMAALGMDDEILASDWAWMCTMCQRCISVCPMKINIPQLIFNVRASWPRENRPKGILGSCDMALRHDTCSAMGASEGDWRFVVEDVADEVREMQPGFEEIQVPMEGGCLLSQPELPGAGHRAGRDDPPLEDPAAGGRGLDLRIERMGRRKLLHVPGRRQGLGAHRPDQGESR